jgi:hypothetical protein
MQCTHIGRIDSNPAAVDTLLRRIPSPVAGKLVQGLASMPGCIESFYKSIHSSLEAGLIHKGATRLRNTVQLFPITTSERISLFDLAHTREEIRQTKYLVEVLYYLEPVFAILAALALRWLADDFDLELPLEKCSDCVSFMPIGFHDLGLTADLSTFSSALGPREFDSNSDRLRLITKAKSLSRSIALLPVRHPRGIDKLALKELINRSLKASAQALITASALRKIFIANEVADRKMRDSFNKLGRAL